jgi:hypothetical protein
LKAKLIQFFVGVGMAYGGFRLILSHHETMGWPAWLGLGLMLVGAILGVNVLGVAGGKPRQIVNVFCADCGQFLGPSNGFDCPCPRCGCNRYTTEDDGVGRTTRVR